jgi:peptidoglycan/LPS O-acetylase OafA/YrhL
VAALDGIRALAAFEVFVFHAFGGNPFYGQWPVVKHGDLGVQVFFVLSGFLITTRLYALLDRAELGAGRRWRRFLLRRSARIFPLYYATLLVLLFFGRALGFQILPLAWPWLFAYAMNVLVFLRGGWVGDGGHLWSLCVEEQFYLAFPALVLTPARRWLGPLSLAGIGVAYGLRAFVVVPSYEGGFAFALPPLSLDALGAGVIACILSREGRVASVTRKAFGWLGALAGCAFVALATTDPRPQPLAAAIPTLLALATAALIVTLWEGRLSVVAAVLGFRPLAAFGRVTYGFYVFHVFALTYLWRFRVAWIPAMALPRAEVAFAASVGLAVASYALFERPILRLAHRWSPD